MPPACPPGSVNDDIITLLNFITSDLTVLIFCGVQSDRRFDCINIGSVETRVLVKCRCADLRSGKMRRNDADIICGCYGYLNILLCVLHG